MTRRGSAGTCGSTSASSIPSCSAKSDTRPTDPRPLDDDELARIIPTDISVTSFLARIADITVGPRHRKELGDLQPLMQSIEAVGLLHPPVVLPDGTLVAGQRRLEALRRLGWTETMVYVIN